MGIYTNISEVQKEIGYLHSKRTDILKEVNRVSTSVNGTTKDVFHKTVALYDEWDIVEYVYAVQAIGVKKYLASSYVTVINSGSLGSEYGSISVFNDVGGSFGLEFHPKEDYVLVVWLLVYAKTSDNRLVSLPGIYSKVNSTLGDSWKDWYNATKPYLPHMLGVMSIENRTDLSSGQTASNTEIINNFCQNIIFNNASFEVSGTTNAALVVCYNTLSNNGFPFGKYFTWDGYGIGYTENRGESTGTAMGPVAYNEKISAANIFVKPSGYVKCGDVTSRACFNYSAKDIVAKFKGKNIPVTIDLGKIIL